MILFGKKPKVTTEEFCENFYNNHVFSPNIGKVDPWHLFCDTFYQQMIESDSSFSRVDTSILRDELLALRLEVIGIGFFMKVKERLAPIQSEFTRMYLTKHNKNYIWEKMEPYNKAVAESTTGGSDPESGTGRAHITFINSMRAEMFDEWMIIVDDPKDAARAANRIGCKGIWDTQRIQTYLSFAFTNQLKCNINDEARFKIISLVQGFYLGITGALSEVKIIG